MLGMVCLALKRQAMFSEEFGKLGIELIPAVQKLKLVSSPLSLGHKVYFSSPQSAAAVMLAKTRSSSADPGVPIDTFGMQDISLTFPSPRPQHASSGTSQNHEHSIICPAICSPQAVDIVNLQ